jgi:NADPH2:quinone reductase
MKAVRFHEFGDPSVLRVDEVEKPQPGAGEVLIRVAVAGVNYADTMLRAGTYFTKPPLPATPGFEVAGVIEAIGEEVSNLQVGQRVTAMLAGGGYAEYVVAKASQVVPIPEGLDFGKATAILVQGWTALGLLKGLREGQTMLVHAAAGGVGSLLVQLAKLKGARVIGTASTQEKLETVKSLGADVVVNYTESDWTAQVLSATEGKGVDLLIEMVGGEIGSQNIRCLAAGGTMIVYGSASAKDFQISAGGLMSKNLTVKGYTLYSETPQTLGVFTGELMSHLNGKRLQVMVQEFPLADAVAAHHAMEGRKTKGKVVLTV